MATLVFRFVACIENYELLVVEMLPDTDVVFDVIHADEALIAANDC